MAEQIIMPKLGVNMENGTIVKWLKVEGEWVDKNEALLEVQTDKVVMEVESTAEGYLIKVLCEAGQSIPVGEPIALIGEQGEDVFISFNSGKKPQVIESNNQGEEEFNKGSISTVQSGRKERILASPLAKKVAKEYGLALEDISGSGRGGRITQKDVLNAKLEKEKQADKNVDTSSTPQESSLAPREMKRVPLEGRRLIIAMNMAKSAATTAPVTITASADFTNCMDIKKNISETIKIKVGEKATYTDFMIMALAHAIKEHPIVNTTLVENEVIFWKDINIGIAVDTPEGLIVPVIRHADTKRLSEIVLERKRLVAAARNGKLKPDDLTGGTFTLTNLGSYDVEFFSPIIRLPETAILGMGNIRPGGQKLLEGREQSVIGLSLVVDHRVIDGGPAARFLQTLKKLLEKPYWYLL